MMFKDVKIENEKSIIEVSINGIIVTSLFRGNDELFNSIGLKDCMRGFTSKCYLTMLE